jgi:hypothetical protein
MKSMVTNDDITIMLNQLRVAQDLLKSASLVRNPASYLRHSSELLSAQIDLVVDRLERVEAKK